MLSKVVSNSLTHSLPTVWNGGIGALMASARYRFLDLGARLWIVNLLNMDIQAPGGRGKGFWELSWGVFLFLCPCSRVLVRSKIF